MDGQHLLYKAPGVSLCVKLGFPGDKLVTEKVAGSHLDLVDYIIPAYHLGKIAPAPEVIKQPDSKQPDAVVAVAKQPDVKQPEIKIDARYKCKGVRVRFHFLQNLKNYEKISLRC